MLIVESDMKPVLHIPEAEICRLTLARTFLIELQECITKNHYNDFNEFVPDPTGRLARRFQKQFNYVGRSIPVAWHYAALAAEDLVPEQFREKLADPQNIDHNRQHLAHVGNNVIVGSTYDLRLAGFNEADLNDAGMVLMIDSFTHDHLQIDRKIKDGHDYLGGLFTAGLMRLARLKWGLPFTERQESLAWFSVYWHSYPEKMGDEAMLSTEQLLHTYGEKLGWNDPLSLLYWLKDELGNRGVNLADFSCRLGRQDIDFAKWLSQRLAAADKRASYAPPFLSLIRTIATGEKPFIDKECLGQPLEYFLRFAKRENVLSRTLFEDYRDLEKVGFSAFELEWLKLNKGKKLDYLFKIGRALVNNDFYLITEKFQNYCQEAVLESFREREIDDQKRLMLLGLFPNLLAHSDYKTLKVFPTDLAATIRLIADDYLSARHLLQIKGSQLREDLQIKGMSNEQFIFWLGDLINEVKSTNKLNVIGRHTPVPHNMPVYCVSLGVVK